MTYEEVLHAANDFGKRYGMNLRRVHYGIYMPPVAITNDFAVVQGDVPTMLTATGSIARFSVYYTGAESSNSFGLKPVQVMSVFRWQDIIHPNVFNPSLNIYKWWGDREFYLIEQTPLVGLFAPNQWQQPANGTVFGNFGQSVVAQGSWPCYRIQYDPIRNLVIPVTI
jgi:hypothetical protein